MRERLGVERVETFVDLFPVSRTQSNGLKLNISQIDSHSRSMLSLSLSLFAHIAADDRPATVTLPKSERNQHLTPTTHSTLIFHQIEKIKH